MKIGFIGTGAIAAAMVKALSGQGHDILISPRNAAMAAALTAAHADVQIASNADIAAQADVSILCLMAGVARAVLPVLSFKSGGHIISVMVDIDRAALMDYAPAAASWNITIPLPQIEAGGCPLPCYPAADLIAELFGPTNPAFAVKDERALNAHFAASALMSTTLDQVATGAAWLTQFTGNRDAAELYLGKMLGGALNALGTSTSTAAMLAELSSEGGLNATLKGKLRDAGAPEALTQGLDDFRERLGL